MIFWSKTRTRVNNEILECLIDETTDKSDYKRHRSSNFINDRVAEERLFTENGISWHITTKGNGKNGRIKTHSRDKKGRTNKISNHNIANERLGNKHITKQRIVGVEKLFMGHSTIKQNRTNKIYNN